MFRQNFVDEALQIVVGWRCRLSMPRDELLKLFRTLRLHGLNKERLGLCSCEKEVRVLVRSLSTESLPVRRLFATAETNARISDGDTGELSIVISCFANRPRRSCAILKRVDDKPDSCLTCIKLTSLQCFDDDLLLWPSRRRLQQERMKCQTQSYRGDQRRPWPVHRCRASGLEWHRGVQGAPSADGPHSPEKKSSAKVPKECTLEF